jgi:hypothetical protein
MTGSSLIGFAALLILGGCAEGWKASPQDARNWLPGAVPQLRRVVIGLRTCQPFRASGYNTLWASGSDGGAEAIHCRFGSDAPITEIQTAMRNANVLGVSYTPSDSPAKRVPSVSFILFRQGLAVAGSSTSVIYTARPQSCRGQSESSDGLVVESRPITAAPCRWLWEHDAD